MALAQLEGQSVQSHPKAKDQGREQQLDFFVSQNPRAILDTYGSQRRQQQLLDIYRNPYNWAIQGAFSNLAKILGSTPWEVRGPTTGTYNSDYFQDVFENADFGAGYLNMIQKVVLDLLRYDRGAFMEIIGPGRAKSALDGAVTGIAHLDSLRCFPTGDPIYPVIYLDIKKKMHTLHHTRVIRMVDNPDGDARKPGYGLCALSRAVSISMRELRMGQYVDAMLDDKPAPGIVSASGFTETQRDAATAKYTQEQTSDSLPIYGNQLWLFGVDRDAGVDLEFHTFMQPPEKFDFEAYTGKVDMPALALAIGVDVQDLWQLTGGNIGSATQSEILHQKSIGKLIGTVRGELERRFNFDVLPDEMAFRHTFKDTQEDRARAETADIWIKGISVASANLNDDEIRRLLAGVDDRFRDVLTTEAGEVVIRTDEDKLAANQESQVRDGNQTSTHADNGDQVPTSDASERTRQLALDLGGLGDSDLDTSAAAEVEKDFQVTRLNFEAAWEDMVNAAKSGDMPRNRFRFVSRAILRRHGQQALKDGLEDGGVVVTTLDDEDVIRFGSWLASRSGFINGLAERIYKDGVNINAAQTALMWANNSLQEMYFEGLLSANKNGMFEFAGNDGAENCPTCRRLKGQRHRMKDWSRRRLRPGVDVDNFDCGGFNCAHVLVRTESRARGRL